MLTAQKKRWFDAVFSVYNRNLIKRRFHTLKVENLENLKHREINVPLVIYGNHSSWWDGLIVYQLGKECAFDHYVMMEERQLKNLQLFRKLGAFSVVRENPREALKSINYAVDLLRENATRTLWIFPQGEIKPNDARPLGFFRGLAKIVEKLEICDVVPLALRYEFLNKFKPEIYAKIGEVRKYRSGEKIFSKQLTGKMEIELTELLDDLKNEIAAGKTGSYLNIIR